MYRLDDTVTFTITQVWLDKVRQAEFGFYKRLFERCNIPFMGHSKYYYLSARSEKFLIGKSVTFKIGLQDELLPDRVAILKGIHFLKVHRRKMIDKGIGFSNNSGQSSAVHRRKMNEHAQRVARLLVSIGKHRMAKRVWGMRIV